MAVPRFTGVSHVELTVRDAERSGEWYRDVLGLRLVSYPDEYRTPGVAARITNAIHPTGLTLGFVQHDAGDGTDFSELRVGLDHLAFAVESRAELQAWVEHLDARGVEHSPIQDMPYGSVVVLRDPDNIQLELIAVGSDVRRSAT